jgi:hypothetical protein
MLSIERRELEATKESRQALSRHLFDCKEGLTPMAGEGTSF